MRLLAGLFLAMLPLGGADLQIDHVTVAGTALDAMRQAFTATTGIPTEYGGPHSNHATEMALVSFPDGSYIELMGIQPHADEAAVAAHTWHRYLGSNAGPCAFAIRVPDMSGEIARLRSTGLEVKAAERSGRTRPDGTRIAWDITDIGTDPRGSFFPFLIRDVTAREVRVYPGGKPTTDRFRGIGKVVIGVANLDASIGRYRRAFGLPEPRR